MRLDRGLARYLEHAEEAPILLKLFFSLTIMNLVAFQTCQVRPSRPLDI